MSIALPASATTRRSEIAEQSSATRHANRLAAAAYPELAETGAYAKPIGLVNEGNTCFFNSTFQALAASRPLIHLLAPVVVPSKASSSTPDKLSNSNEEPSSSPGSAPLEAQPQSQASISLVEDPYLLAAHSRYPPVEISTGSAGSVRITPRDIPSLRDEALEPENANLLPVTFAFERALGRAWKAKDAIAGCLSAAAAEAEQQKSLSLKSLLRELSKKYDQYDEYRQQDAHELLRHLLDSMSMEEKDVIKRLQPPPPEDTISPRKRPRGRSRGDSLSSAQIQMAGGMDEISSGRMVPFSDALFGGSLVSVVICEGCKSVSHTYEGFLDISLSIRGEVPRNRTRDRFKAFAKRLRPGSTKPRPSESDSSSQPPINLEGVHSDRGASDGEETLAEDSYSTAVATTENDRSYADSASDVSSVRPDSAGSGAKSSKTLKKAGSLTSWAQRRSSRQSSLRSPSVDSREGSVSSLPASMENSMASLGERARASSNASEAPSEIAAPKPPPEQAAYIRRILHGPQLPPKIDPVEKLRNGMANMHAHQGHESNNSKPIDQERGGREIEGLDTDLMECLRNFTAIEVLEGENAFACHKCWRIQTGRFKQKRKNGMPSSELATQQEEDEDDAGEADREKALLASPVPEIQLDGHQVQESSADMSSGGKVHHERIPPLALDRNSLSAPENTGKSRTASTSSGSSTTGSLSGYTTSEEESSDEGRARITLIRPPMPSRRKSVHSVMRRAVKRYMIARPPPILVFHFKRFMQSSKHPAAHMYASTFASLKKVDDFVSFPERLDLSPFIAPKRSDYKVEIGADGQPWGKYMDYPPGDQGPALEPIRYRLYAVVVHIGISTLGGHYVSYVLVEPRSILKHLEGDASAPASDPHSGPEIDPALRKLAFKDGANVGTESTESKEKVTSGSNNSRDSRVWCFCSDQQIRLASVEEVLKAKAYLCFYEQTL